MKTYLNVQSGKWKNKKILAPEPIRGNSNFTPAKVKEAIFSIIESQLLKSGEERDRFVFVDLFAGSGQMGFEAYSRGFANCILVELDKSRFQSLVLNAKNLDSSHTLNLHNKDGFRYADKIQTSEEQKLIFFLDPPYTYWKDPEKMQNLVRKLISTYKPSPLVLIQSDINPNWTEFEPRNFGNNWVLTYGRLK
ncbi:MAG: 23S rRNA (adenine(2030)-N(6))-methyltransferase RlmJ [Leptospiraceae bacterium]|nr:23S rRNA (adenine(2030)-N(6))-methyltransferase RlmJ [Leptospiraceae bacterium]MCP5513626.1 23S rRNA (adenine(2030)-N(6))-methyltransferase RlmJ [Leptospiraceae bacterium]